MAMYDYNLYIVREVERGELLPEFFRLGILENEEDASMACMLGRVWCGYEELVILKDSTCPVNILTIAFNNSELESLLDQDAQAFVSWLWELAKATNIAYAFIGGGSSPDYYKVRKIADKEVFSQLGNLVCDGKVKFAHPVMLFSERLGNGSVCALAKGAPKYDVYEMPGIGCLLMLVAGEPYSDSLEILDPGIIYPELRDYFQKR